jgi:hypothetical protein
MKSKFIKPKITIENKVILEKTLCLSKETFGTRAAEFGFDYDSYFTNKSWYNEFYGGTSVGIEPGDIAAQSKERGGEWGNLW